MNLLVEIDEEKVAAMGAIIITNVNSLFDSEKINSAVFIPGFFPKDPTNKEPLVKISLVTGKVVRSSTPVVQSIKKPAKKKKK